MLQEVGQRTTKKLTIGGIKESFKAFVVKYFLQGKYYLSLLITYSMVIWVVKFPRGDTKLDRFSKEITVFCQYK